MKKILTIGAYERDNFGDLLFLMLTKKYFKQAILVPASVKFARMYAIDEVILPYHELLADYRWDAVIVVGGEVGGLDIDGALKMSLKSKLGGVYWYGEESIKKRIKRFLFTPPGNGPAYIPDLANYPNNRDTFFLLNSVGLSFARHKVLNNETNESLKKTKRIAVRDPASRDRCARLGVSSTLVPDVVHTINLHFDIKVEENSKYIAFQASEELIEKHSIKGVVNSINNLAMGLDMPVLLVAAGTAPLHDSYDKYEEVAAAVNKKTGKTTVRIGRDRDPVKIVEQIAGSQLWVGSSLHGRVVSIAYSVPRVSLSVNKVTEYARHWDSQYPFDVDMDNLLEESKKALGAMEERDRKKLARELAVKADKNMQKMVKEIMA